MLASMLHKRISCAPAEHNLRTDVITSGMFVLVVPSAPCKLVVNAMNLLQKNKVRFCSSAICLFTTIMFWLAQY